MVICVCAMGGVHSAIIISKVHFTTHQGASIWIDPESVVSVFEREDGLQEKYGITIIIQKNGDRIDVFCLNIPAIDVVCSLREAAQRQPEVATAEVATAEATTSQESR